MLDVYHGFPDQIERGVDCHFFRRAEAKPLDEHGMYHSEIRCDPATWCYDRPKQYGRTSLSLELAPARFWIGIGTLPDML